jgi:glycine/D-amino acid oxidase-like deaminating enzyme
MGSDFDVVVIGAGCGGLFTSLELARRRRRCLLLDRAPIGSYASTSNQGWLQSGALYAGLKQPDVAAACREGFDLLRRLCPQAVRDDIKGYFLFADERSRDTFYDLSKLADIDAHRISPQKIPGERLVRGTTFSHALSVPDRPFDTSLILNTVAKLATEAGVQIAGIENMAQCALSRTGSQWRVSYGEGRSVSCEAIVLTGGAYTGPLLNQVKSSSASKVLTTKITVVGLHYPLCSTLLAAPVVDDAPNVVPFRIGETNGVTISLTKADVRTTPDDLEVPRGDLINIADQLSFWFPEIVRIVDRQKAAATIYCCQKIEYTNDPGLLTANRKHLLLDHGSEGSDFAGLVTFYPGKFTASPIVARSCADTVEKILATHSTAGAPLPSMTLNVPVARQKYLAEEATFALTATKDKTSVEFARSPA